MLGKVGSLLILALVLSRCASISVPTGGPKDEAPPTLIASIPQHQSRNNQNTRQVILTFSEKVATTKLADNLIINPKPAEQPSISTKGTSVILLFNETLLPNTTYSIDTRAGVQDLTEGNIAQDVCIAFSTGPQLDTGKIQGRVIDAYTLSPLPNITVAIADSLNLNSLKQPARTIARSQADGSYSLENLKPGQYYLYAFADKNKNGGYDNRNEGLAYAPEIIQLDSTASVDLRLSFHDGEKPRYTSQSEEAGGVRLNLNKGLETHSIAKGPKEAYLFPTKKGPQLRGLKGTDSLDIALYALDSSGNDTTFYLKILPHTKPDTTLAKSLYTIQPGKGQPISRSTGITLTFRDRLNKAKLENIVAMPDSVLKKNELKAEWTNDSTELRLLPSTKAKVLYLIIPAHTFAGRTAGSHARSDTLRYPLQQENEGGIINAVVQDSIAGSFVLELIDDKGKTVTSVRNRKRHSFSDVAAGNYRLRLVVDSDENGRFSWANLSLGRQPEKVYITRQSILIKPNFEIDEVKVPD